MRNSEWILKHNRQNKNAQLFGVFKSKRGINLYSHMAE